MFWDVFCRAGWWFQPLRIFVSWDVIPTIWKTEQVPNQPAFDPRVSRLISTAEESPDLGGKSVQLSVVASAGSPHPGFSGEPIAGWFMMENPIEKMNDLLYKWPRVGKIIHTWSIRGISLTWIEANWEFPSPALIKFTQIKVSTPDLW